jgi:hypothetical protein
MTEWLKIIYDIMAGLGFLTVFIITVAFTWGIFLSFSASRAERKQAAADELMGKLAPEMQLKKLEAMKAEAEKQLDALNSKSKPVMDKLAKKAKK